MEQIHPQTIIGHVHLKVSDLQASIKFYTEILGFSLTQHYGSSAAFLSAGGYHHHIGLNTWESKGGTPPPGGTTGLYHFAILLPDRKALSTLLRNLVEAGWPIDGSADHGVSEAIYFRDPDQNGIEIYVDRPEDEWPRNPDGSLCMGTQALDMDALLKLSDKE